MAILAANAAKARAVPSDIEIAQKAKMKRIAEVARELGIPEQAIVPFGHYKAKISLEDINLHFTGDFSAIALANNLLAAMIDNHINHGNELGFDVRRIAWKRVLDMNDRALRQITIALGGPANGFPREDGFDIVVASEVMAIFCLSTSIKDLKERLGKIVCGYTKDQKPILARDLKAHGAMAALLKDALAPNLLQT